MKNYNSIDRELVRELIRVKAFSRSPQKELQNRNRDSLSRLIKTGEVGIY